MKKMYLTLMLCCFICASVHAEVKEDSMGLQMTGFTVMSENSVAMNFKFQDNLKLTISKERFNSQKSAEKFCTDQKSNLDKDFNALLIAMSGATLFNKFLKDAVSFSFTKDGNSVSGIRQWANGSDAVQLMYDGRGTDLYTVSTSEFSLDGDLQIPAICSKNL